MRGIKYRKMLDKPHRQFGVVPCDLPSSELRTRGQVVGRIMKLRVEKMAVRGTDEKHVPVKPIISQVAAGVADVWARSSVPSRRIDRVVTKITTLWGKKDEIERSYSAIRSEVAADMSALLDISASADSVTATAWTRTAGCSASGRLLIGCRAINVFHQATSSIHQRVRQNDDQ